MNSECSEQNEHLNNESNKVCAAIAEAAVRPPTRFREWQS